MTDPRGVERTVATSQLATDNSSRLVTFVECGHVGRFNATMSGGATAFCLGCGHEQQIKALKAEVKHLHGEVNHLVNG